MSSQPKYASRLRSDAPTGVRARVVGVINKLVQRTFLNYAALFTVVGVAAFLVLHYWTALFKHPETGRKQILRQAGAAAALGVIASAFAFFTRML